MVRPTLALVLAAFLAVAPASAGGPVDLELVLAIDVSGSIDPDEAKLQREGYIAALTDARVIRAIESGIHGKIAIAYVEWASVHQRWTLLDWTVIDGAATAQAVAATLTALPITIGMRTSISGAVDYAMAMLERSPYEGIRRIIDISGDGPNNDGGPITDARNRALADGIVINGLPIINDRPNRWGFPTMKDLDLYYAGCVIGGPGSFVVVAESFTAFPAAIRQKLIMEIADDRRQPRRLASADEDRALLAEMPRDYGPGCDIGERQSREYYRYRWGQ